MRKLRMFLLYLSPHVLWMLPLSLLYSIPTYLVAKNIFQMQSLNASMFYVRGLCLLAPLILFALGVKKAKYIWQFIPYSILVIVGIHLVIGDVLFTVLSIVCCLMRGANRVHQQLQIMDEELPQPCILDEPAAFLLGVPVVCFLFMGYWEQPYFQQKALYHFVAMVGLFFVDSGLRRFETYVKMSEMNDNVPTKRILETGTRIFAITAILLCLFLVPILRTQYTFVPIHFTLPEGEYVEQEIEQKEQAKDEMGNSTALSELGEEKEPPVVLVWIWKVLEWGMMAVLYLGGGYVVVRWVYSMVVNFNKTQVETHDVIESTMTRADESYSTARRKQGFAEWFDFSEAMKIRRQYKKTLKKYKPEPWQTPSEMETMAQQQIPELHQQYEKVRYGQGS